MTPKIVVAQKEHIPKIAMACREADRRELWDICEMDPYTALFASLNAAESAWTGMADVIPVCMFGVSPAAGLRGDVGIPWLIGTDFIDQYAKEFLRHNKRYVQIMLAHHKRLHNWVSCANIRSIEWLEWLGFTMGKPEKVGPFKKEFIPFWMERE